MITEHIKSFKLWLQNQKKDARWCIVVCADPDALASAMALRRILRSRAQKVDLARINAVTRPDNLAMIRYLRIPVLEWKEDLIQNYSNFAIVDSQPRHNSVFEQLRFDLLIDHHPPTPIEDFLNPNAYCVIRPNIGATASMMARLLRAMQIRPGPLLATGLIYGIRTDTAALERSGCEDDFRAYQWLTRFANIALLRRISRSEYLRAWLPLFSRAFRSLTDCSAGGAHASLNEVKSADLLVSVADFFTKVHGLKWIAVSGIVNKTVIVIFRGDGGRDMGDMASSCFGDLGKGGGHRTLARAEIPLEALPTDLKPGEFVYKRLQAYKTQLAQIKVEHERAENEQAKT